MKKQNLILAAVLATAIAATGAQAATYGTLDADFDEYWMSGGDTMARNVTDQRFDADYDAFEVSGDPDRYPPVELAFHPILDADHDMGIGGADNCTAEAALAVR